MKVLIMRHGEAVGLGAIAVDAHRYLTDHGRQTTSRVGAVLRDLGHVPTHLYTSPLVRAVQTAELVAAALGHGGPIPSLPPLRPGGDVSHALGILDHHGPEDVVGLVSHEPTVSAMASQLMGIRYSGFPTSGVAVFEGNARGASLLGRLDPVSLRFG